MTTIFAYLDPGSSSMIVQMFLGGLAAAGVALKLYWRRLLKFLHLRDEDPEVEVSSRKARRAAASETPVEREPVESTKS